MGDFHHFRRIRKSNQPLSWRVSALEKLRSSYLSSCPILWSFEGFINCVSQRLPFHYNGGGGDTHTKNMQYNISK
jgi:hypothetical protein